MALFIPRIAYAADDILSIKELMFRVSYYVINPLIMLGFVVALVYLIWGIMDFLRNRDTNATLAQEGKWHMLYGIIGMVIMVSAFAIVEFLRNAVGADPQITESIRN